MIVIAIEDFDIDSSVGHPAGELTELTGLRLVETLDEDLVYRDDFDAGRFERRASSFAVFEEKVRDSASAVGGMDDPRAAAFDADASASEGVAHVGQRTGMIFEGDGEIVHS
jgi:hypothetical protein